jgi:hypothetical protein
MSLSLERGHGPGRAPAPRTGLSAPAGTWRLKIKTRPSGAWEAGLCEAAKRGRSIGPPPGKLMKLSLPCPASPRQTRPRRTGPGPAPPGHASTHGNASR